MAYARAAAELAAAGKLGRREAEFILEMALDSIVHKNVVAALLKSLEELEQLRSAVEPAVERASGSGSLEELEEVIRRHDELERGMVAFYRRLAREAPNTTMRAILEALAEDERRHDEYLRRIRSLLTGSGGGGEENRVG